MDKRSYSRFRVANMVTCLYADGIVEEANGTIHDISEYGIGIFIPAKELSKVKLNVGDEVTFVFCDDVTIGSYNRKFVLVGDVIVRHVNSTTDGLLIGGRVHNNDYRDYYLKKELVFTRNMLKIS